MKKEYISIVIGILALALVGQGIWLFNIYRANHANDFSIENLPTEDTPSPPPTAGPLPQGERREVGDESEPITWNAQLKNQSTKLISLAPGKTATLWATFENTGTSTWTSENTFLQLLTDDEADISPWYSPTWVGKKRVTALQEASVGPNAQGTFTFTVTAPSVPGTYTLVLRPIYLQETKYLWLGTRTHLQFTITVRAPR